MTGTAACALKKQQLTELQKMQMSEEESETGNEILDLSENLIKEQVCLVGFVQAVKLCFFPTKH